MNPRLCDDAIKGWVARATGPCWRATSPPVSRDMGTVETESQAKPADFKEVGTGTLDIPKILKTALKTGVDKFFVEQDQCPGDPIDSLKLSFENLKKMSL